MAPFEMLPAARRIVQGIMGVHEGEHVMDMIFTDPVMTFDDRVVMSDGRIHLQ